MLTSCLVNYADAKGWYPKGQKRLSDSFKKYAPDCYQRLHNRPPAGCPSHQDVPYAFKPYTIIQAWECGAKMILWCDAAVWAVKDVSPIFEAIKRRGMLLFKGGWNCGQWTTDYCLKTLNTTREDAFNIEHIAACVMGFDMTSQVARSFLTRWFEICKTDPESFRGPWRYNPGEEPSQGVMGHRHDQSVASLIAHDMGIPLSDCRPLFSYWSEEAEKECILVTRGGIK